MAIEGDRAVFFEGEGIGLVVAIRNGAMGEAKPAGVYAEDDLFRANLDDGVVRGVKAVGSGVERRREAQEVQSSTWSWGSIKTQSGDWIRSSDLISRRVLKDDHSGFFVLACVCVCDSLH